MIPGEDPGFALLAARSSFVRAQLRATHGQTRPRIQASDLGGLLVPDPGAELREILSRELESAQKARRQARQRLDRLSELYEAYGRGELSAEDFRDSLSRLEAPTRE